MAHSNNCIFAPIQMPDDFSAILQIGGTDLEAICKSTAINKWAKYKPVSKNVIEALTDAQRQSVNYGISKIPTWGNIINMIEFWLLNNRTAATAPDCGLVNEYWDYTHPSGGSNSPYRLTDFAISSSVGYFHGAEAPLGNLQSLQLTITANGQLVMVWNTGAQSAMTLKFTDLKYDGGSQISLAGFYFTAVLARVGATSTKYVMTDTDQSAESAITQGVHCRPWFEDLAHVNDFMGNADQASFYCSVFLTNQQIYDTFTANSTTYRKFLTSLGGISNFNGVAIIDRQTVTITKIVAKFIIVELLAWKNLTQSNQYVYYSVILRNNDTNTRRFFKMVVEVKDSNDNVLASVTYNSASDYVDAGATKTVADSIYVGQYFSGASKVTVTTEINPNRDQALIKGTDTSTVSISSAPPV